MHYSDNKAAIENVILISDVELHGQANHTYRYQPPRYD